VVVVAIAAASLLVQCASPSATLKPFLSDGCSGFPDGTLRDPALWREYCVTHDLAYWRGGTADERLAADRAFRKSLAGEGHPVVAEIAYLGVRFGGVPWWPTSWRWGYGWPYPRGYGALTADDRAQVMALDPLP
jgi:hypothetical protein